MRRWVARHRGGGPPPRTVLPLARAVARAARSHPLAHCSGQAPRVRSCPEAVPHLGGVPIRPAGVLAKGGTERGEYSCLYNITTLSPL